MAFDGRMWPRVLVASTAFLCAVAAAGETPSPPGRVRLPCRGELPARPRRVLRRGSCFRGRQAVREHRWLRDIHAAGSGTSRPGRVPAGAGAWGRGLFGGGDWRSSATGSCSSPGGRGVGFVYDARDPAHRGQLRLRGVRGWGLASDGEARGHERRHGHAAVSSTPATLEESRPHPGSWPGGGPSRGLNELELVDGVLYANVWRTDRNRDDRPRKTADCGVGWDLARHPPRSCSGARPPPKLNGNRPRPGDGDACFVTGKRWPRLFEIELVAGRRGVARRRVRRPGGRFPRLPCTRSEDDQGAFPGWPPRSRLRGATPARMASPRLDQRQVGFFQYARVSRNAGCAGWKSGSVQTTCSSAAPTSVLMAQVPKIPRSPPFEGHRCVSGSTVSPSEQGDVVDHLPGLAPRRASPSRSAGRCSGAASGSPRGPMRGSSGGVPFRRRQVAAHRHAHAGRRFATSSGVARIEVGETGAAEEAHANAGAGRGEGPPCAACHRTARRACSLPPTRRRGPEAPLVVGRDEAVTAGRCPSSTVSPARFLAVRYDRNRTAPVRRHLVQPRGIPVGLLLERPCGRVGVARADEAEAVRVSPTPPSAITRTPGAARCARSWPSGSLRMEVETR